MASKALDKLIPMYIYSAEDVEINYITQRTTIMLMSTTLKF